MSGVQSVIGGSDPMFVFTPAGRLDCPADTEVQEAWRHFTVQVARDPLDLEAHTRRVLLASRPPLTDRAFGALVDLFMALGGRGRGLRRQLLEQAMPWLDPDDAHFLRLHLDTELPRGAQLPSQRWSVLDTAVLGSLRMVDLQRRQVAQETPFQQAMSLLEYGDLAGARGMLEAALLEEPDHEEVNRELLAIYQHSRDDAGKAAMAEQLVARHGALPAGWA